MEGPRPRPSARIASRPPAAAGGSRERERGRTGILTQNDVGNFLCRGPAPSRNGKSKDKETDGKIYEQIGYSLTRSPTDLEIRSTLLQRRGIASINYNSSLRGFRRKLFVAPAKKIQFHAECITRSPRPRPLDLLAGLAAGIAKY